MLQKLLKLLQKASSTAGSMLTVQENLKESRVYEFLKEVGRARAVHPATPNYIDVQAQQTSWSDGYNQCLDDIMMFRERFLEANTEKTLPRMGFGGLEFALFKDDLTEEEAHAIRTGKPIPKHTAVTKEYIRKTPTSR
jgi:hypothetical protein